MRRTSTVEIVDDRRRGGNLLDQFLDARLDIGLRGAQGLGHLIDLIGLKGQTAAGLENAVEPLGHGPGPVVVVRQIPGADSMTVPSPRNPVLLGHQAIQSEALVAGKLED